MKIGADRIHQIVLSMRIFARLDEAGTKAIDLHESIENTLVILNSQLHDIELAKHYGNLPLVECYPVQINQVFMNLITNAIDAVKERSPEEPKQIAIVTEADDRVVRIAIRDNGFGIPTYVREKIFDPFFTTKEVGKGTGLGLSTCYDIVQKHRGRIEVSSPVAGGAEFVVTLPITRI